MINCTQRVNIIIVLLKNIKAEYYLCPVKKVALILILALFLKPFFPVIEYVVNYEYISKVLCENKDKPVMHCNGKCYLMKELAKASDAEKPNSTEKKTNTPPMHDLFVEDLYTIDFVTFFETNTKSTLNSKYANLYAHLNLHAIFHPPPFLLFK